MSAHPNGDTEVSVGHSHSSSSTRRPLPSPNDQDAPITSGANRLQMSGALSPSCHADVYTLSAMAVDVDDDEEEDTQSSMWVEQDGYGHTPSPQLPSDFLEPLSPGADSTAPLPTTETHTQNQSTVRVRESRQFWKSGGDFVVSYEGSTAATEGIDHARVHPKFLHSNATSHKWVLGAIAELLDNAIDEIRNGATFVKVDVMPNPRNGEPMLVIEDDGGGMDPECMRCCMSLGYSAKSKLSNTIGQYGNGFKTSTMRLGGDVLVVSRNGGKKPSESIGMLSYTFLTCTGQNDVVVPIVDFQTEAFGIRKLIRTSVDDWVKSMHTIETWSPFSSQTELVSQFKSMPRNHGTRIIIYNLWEDDEGLLELDFTTHVHDIQLRTTTRNEKTLKIATTYPSCHHYLTYHHSLRTYASILYLRLPPEFRIILRGKQVRQHNLRDDMMVVEEVRYRPKELGQAKAVVTLGFIKDAKEHIDVSGFCVYHKNRLIRPFWRLWNPSDTRGRGIIAILEANFVEPAHDKQGFERTTVLSRLETRLIEMQKAYFGKNCQLIGYRNPMKKRGRRPPSVNVSSKTNGGSASMDISSRINGGKEHGDVVMGISAASSHGVENRQRDVLHLHHKTKEQERQGISSSALLVHGTYVDPSTIRQSGLYVDPETIHRALTDIMGGRGPGQSTMQRQDHATASDNVSHHIQSVPTKPARLYVEAPSAPISSCTRLEIQKHSASLPLIPNFIDLESPSSSPRQNQATQEENRSSSSIPAVVVVKEEDVKLERLGMDNCGGPLPGFMSAGDEVPVPDLPETGHAAKNVALLNESTTVSHTGPYIEDNVVHMEAFNTLGSCSELPNSQESTDKLTSPNGVPQGSGTCVDAADLVALSPAMMNDGKLPVVVLEKQQSPSVNLSEASGDDPFISLARSGNAEEKHCSTVSCKDAVEEEEKLPQAEMVMPQQGLVVPEIGFVGGHEVICLLPKQGEVKKLAMESQEVVEILPNDDDVKENIICMQESTDIVNHDVKENSIHTHESTDIVNHDGKLVSCTVDRIQGPLDSIQQSLITSSMMTSAITIATSTNPLDVDLTSRFWNAKQMVESLQASIDEMVAETNDLREQLRQEQLLQDLEMKNLHAELQRALSRLEQLQA